MPISRRGTEKTKHDTRKHTFTDQKKCSTTLSKHKKLKPGLVAFYNIRPENREGLFSKEKISKGGDKKERVKKKG